MHGCTSVYRDWSTMRKTTSVRSCGPATESLCEFLSKIDPTELVLIGAGLQIKSMRSIVLLASYCPIDKIGSSGVRLLNLSQ